MIIGSGTLGSQTLAEKVAIVTGAGDGIGYEAARALLWLGAKVVIAEINKTKGKQAERRLNAEFGSGSVLFVNTDVGNERSVEKLKEQSIKEFGKVDIVINNATVAPLGAVKDVSIENWDESYRVNLRAPALFARAFVPDMVARGYGVFMCVSSLGQEFMAAYESMKAAQVHLGSTLAAELEGTGVFAFTIGPGYVPTRTAEESIPKLAALMNKSAEELFAIVKQYEISVEAAGAGFAAAISLAEKYVGQEISSTQALIDAGIEFSHAKPVSISTSLAEEDLGNALKMCRCVRTTLEEQSAGWKERSVFERQWMIRSFRKQAGMPVEKWLEVLERLEEALVIQDGRAVSAIQVPFNMLAGFYANLYEMAKGYIKDANQREEQLAIVDSWREEVEKLQLILKH
jgi:NAD(P)-dependent dehydrogenase (short-subunit alcohol dehydrogenase family)